MLVVPKGWAVDMDHGSTLNGSMVNRVGEPPVPGAPVLRVSGTVSSGVIRARYPYRSFRDWLLGRPR